MVVEMCVITVDSRHVCHREVTSVSVCTNLQFVSLCEIIPLFILPSRCVPCLLIDASHMPCVDVAPVAVEVLVVG